MHALPVQQRPPDEDDNEEPMEFDMAEVEEQEELPVLDEVQLDLESFVAPYTGLILIRRLEFIADHCNSLRPRALDMAIKCIKGTSHNTLDYTRLSQKLEHALVNMPDEAKRGIVEQQCDTAWIDAKRKEANTRLNNLDTELKKIRANFIKETLRRAHNDFAEHYQDCGDLEKALSAYMTALDFTTSARNQVVQYLSVIWLNVLLKRWTSVSTTVLRFEGANNQDDGDQYYVDKQIKCAAGLYELNQRHYKACAKHLLSTNFDHFDQVKSNLLAPINILTYGSLCALATYSRADLASQLINSASFRQFSELDLQLRDAVNYFYESKYGLCLDILKVIKDSLLLDMYLAPHVETLYSAIRNRALVQYFEPYSSACLRKMAASFTNVPLEELEKEIVNLICDGQIRARIDSHHKILYASKVDARSQIFERALQLGKVWQKQAHALISRTAILNAGLRVGKRTTLTNDTN